MFLGCIFRVQTNGVAPSKQIIRKQKQSTSFVILRADVIFNSENVKDSGLTKEEATGIHSVQFASRTLGTDGMLYLLEQELHKIGDEIEDLEYGGLQESFSIIDKELKIIESQTHQITEKQKEFGATFSNHLQEVRSLVDQCEPVYNNLDFQGTTQDELSE